MSHITKYLYANKAYVLKMMQNLPIHRFTWYKKADNFTSENLKKLPKQKQKQKKVIFWMSYRRIKKRGRRSISSRHFYQKTWNFENWQKIIQNLKEKIKTLNHALFWLLWISIVWKWNCMKLRLIDCIWTNIMNKTLHQKNYQTKNRVRNESLKDILKLINNHLLEFLGKY